jgi:hypothetical protein
MQNPISLVESLTLRNNSIFGESKAKINDSACFIENYYNTTIRVNAGMMIPDHKGKSLLFPMGVTAFGEKKENIHYLEMDQTPVRLG